jgi:predicted DNA-binding protein
MTRRPSTRINARIPPDVARKVAYLESRTHRTTTGVIVESIERFYAAVQS